VSTETTSPLMVEDELGPIDIVIIGYRPDAPMTGDAIPHLLGLVDAGIIRILDVLFVHKNPDGSFSGFEAQDLSEEHIGDLAIFEGASSGLLGEDDVRKAADEIEPGTAAVLLVYENRWAAPFVAAVRRNGGRLLATARIPTQHLIATLDELERGS
jgi:hypothetical protein